MSKQVDVLAVLDETYGLLAGPAAEQLEAARAAIAELIEAATEAFDAPDVMWTIASHSENLAKRLESALSAATGESA